MGADFNRMAERLNDLLQSQRRLVRDVSHELRSPLARLRIALELAERADDPRQALKRIEKEADELERLTTDVLSLARLESGQAMFKRQMFRLDELVAKVVTDADFEARPNVKRIRFSPEPMEVSGDPVLLRSAVEDVVPQPLMCRIQVISSVPGHVHGHGARLERYRSGRKARCRLTPPIRLSCAVIGSLPLRKAGGAEKLRTDKRGF